jgi:hypothetical protein
MEEAVGLPLSDYYDMRALRGNLSKFNPSQRLSAQHNSEATVFFSGMVSGLDLDPASHLYVQAAAAGMSHVAVLRNLLNSALRMRSAAAGVRGSRAAARTASPAHVVQLPAPPPLDPFELAPLLNERPDEVDALIGMNKWRQDTWVDAAETHSHHAKLVSQALGAAEMLEEMLAGRVRLEGEGEGDERVAQRASAKKGGKGKEEGGEDDEGSGRIIVDYDAYFDDWAGEQMDAAPVEAAREEDEITRRAHERLTTPHQATPTVAAQLQELRLRFPGLPEDDLMFVQLGYGPDGRAIDVVALEAICAAKAAEGVPFIASEALSQCLIDPETGEIGTPPEERWGEEGEPGGFRSATAVVPPEEVAAYVDNEARYQNARGSRPQPVWLLVGGEPEGADDAMRSATHIQRLLADQRDVQVWLPACLPACLLLHAPYACPHSSLQ